MPGAERSWAIFFSFGAERSELQEITLDWSGAPRNYFGLERSGAPNIFFRLERSGAPSIFCIGAELQEVFGNWSGG